MKKSAYHHPLLRIGNLLYSAQFAFEQKLASQGLLDPIEFWFSKIVYVKIKDIVQSNITILITTLNEIN